MLDPSTENAPPHPEGETNYKNRLQEFAQKSALPLPIYNTTNEGLPHEPIFKSTVVVNNLVFVSPRTFTRAKAAEQDVAKYAIESLTQKQQEEGCPVLNLCTKQVPASYKSILYEFAVKVDLPMPTYSTKQDDANGTHPAFTSDVEFCGRTYTGHGKNKKEAEQLAARKIIGTILGTSSSRVIMSRIINSKVKQSGAYNEIPVINATSDENQPQTDPLGEYIHSVSDANCGKKRRNKNKKGKPQQKKQRDEEQQESQASQLKSAPEKEQESQVSQLKSPPEEEQGSLNERLSQEEECLTCA